jgi:hypothetical protein
MQKCFSVAMNQARVCAAVLVVCAVKGVELWAGFKVHKMPCLLKQIVRGVKGISPDDGCYFGLYASAFFVRAAQLMLREFVYNGQRKGPLGAKRVIYVVVVVRGWGKWGLEHIIGAVKVP